MSDASYYLYKKQFSYDGTNWFDVQPLTYSYDGDGTMQPVVKEEHDTACGAMPPIYQWVDTQDTMCVGYDKYVVQKRQVSYDNGLTWDDVTPSETRAGSLIEAYSIDCGYVPTTIYRWVDTQDTICVYEGHDYSKDYLTFEIISDGGITWTARDCLWYTGKTISYSMDDGNTWTNITSSTSGTRFHVSAGDKILFKGNNSTYGDDEEPFNACSYSSFSGSTAQFNVYGNIMSLISGDSFENATTLDRGNTFLSLFSDCTGLTSAENLVLPATTLTENCYRSMFYRCSGLTSAPELPATTLASGCYEGMFESCQSLTTAPALPATTLADYCYDSMFRVCYSLTSVPSTLSATTLASSCYAFMFENCSGLTTAPALPATTLAERCYNRMFGNCSSLTTAPVLSATTLADHCYQQMFESCTSLNYIKCLATDISATDCTSNWTRWTSSNGTFVKNASMSSWTTGVNGIPNNWTIQNA